MEGHFQNETCWMTTVGACYVKTLKHNWRERNNQNMRNNLELPANTFEQQHLSTTDLKLKHKSTSKCTESYEKQRQRDLLKASK